MEIQINKFFKTSKQFRKITKLLKNMRLTRSFPKVETDECVKKYIISSLFTQGLSNFFFLVLVMQKTRNLIICNGEK